MSLFCITSTCVIYMKLELVCIWCCRLQAEKTRIKQIVENDASHSQLLDDSVQTLKTEIVNLIDELNATRARENEIEERLERLKKKFATFLLTTFVLFQSNSHVIPSFCNHIKPFNKGSITIRRTAIPSMLVIFSTFAFLLNYSFMK